MPRTDWVQKDLYERLAAIGMEGLWLHLHPSAGRRLFAKRGWHLLWGSPRSVDPRGLVYGPTGFQQLIPTLYELALDEAEGFLSPDNGDSVVDLYSGTGTTLARWKKAGCRTIGVEVSGESVECARLNAPGTIVLRGTCANRLPQLREWIVLGSSAGKRRLYVNPPRTGLEPEVLEWVAGELVPDRIAYLSCSAGTLRRDLDTLVGSGYRVVNITPYDFFPQTHHVETLALLEHQA